MSDSTKFTSKLKGRKVLVIGGSSGLGYSAAEASLEHGMTVIIASSSQDKVDGAIQRMLKEYPSAKDRLSGYACNLGDQASLEQNVVELLEKTGGKLDHIIHSAGDALSNVIKPLADITVDNAVKAHMVRYFAPMMIGKHAKKYMNDNSQSSITFTSGAITLRPRPNWVIPNGVMTGLGGLVRALALEVAPIRVNSVLPGAVETELWGSMSKEDFANFKKGAVDSNPTGRLAGPDDLAEAYLYTMKDPNLTGSTISSESGSSMK